MSVPVLILGESGTGKSTSLRNLDPAQTLLIQCAKKPLPFRSKQWGYLTKENPNGNIFVTSDWMKIIAIMKRTHRQIIVIDDLQYMLSGEYMARAAENGYQKFADLAAHMWQVIHAAMDLPESTRVYFMAHTETTDDGVTRMKSIGKMLHEKLTIEGLFSIVLRTSVVNGNYLFSTKNSGRDTVKTPVGLFEEEAIENDLAIIDAKLFEYYELKEAA